MRKLVLAYTASLLMSPLTGWALGMGDVRVNSHLNQPLNAEIALHSATEKDLELLRITLAPKKVYTRADIEYSEYLSKLIFKVTQRGGKNYIQVTTKKPFKVPFANFLLEASWGSGRLLREYTILLDPPEFIAKHARPITKSPTLKPTGTKYIPSASKNTKHETISTASINKSDVVLKPGNANGQLTSAMTKKHDTLGHVAKRMAPSGVSVEQMMMALLHDNPDAFIDNNINNLKTGYILRVKDRNSLNKLTQKMASNQVKSQYESWKNSRQQKPATNLVDRNARQKAIKNEAKLSLVASGKSNKSAASDGVGAQTETLKEKLLIANEELNSKKIERQELLSRISKLEALIKTKISLIELKDKSLAILQKQNELKNKEKNAEQDEELAENDLIAEMQTPNKNISSVAIKNTIAK